MVTMITAMEIQTNGDDVKCAAYGSNIGLYSGMVELWHSDEMHKVMLSTEPIFLTKKEAINSMEDIVKQVRDIDLDNVFKPKSDEPK